MVLLRPSTSRLLIWVKDSLDPNGILSPGKMGIWPQKYRHLRDTQHAAPATASTSKL